MQDCTVGFGKLNLIKSLKGTFANFAQNYSNHQISIVNCNCPQAHASMLWCGPVFSSPEFLIMVTRRYGDNTWQPVSNTIKCRNVKWDRLILSHNLEMDARSLSTNLGTDTCVDSKSQNHKSVHNWDNYFICISLPYLGCLNSTDFARPNCFPLNIALNRYTICISVRTPHHTDTVYSVYAYCVIG